jgi:CRP/FNR family transcriptional regulator, nitrogen oxide reductase regulator
MTEYEDAIRDVAVFENATPEDINAIARLAFQRTVEEEAYFFMQGDKAEYLYILLSGRVKLCTLSTEGQQVNLRTIIPHQLFGALGAVRPGAGYPAFAQALEDCSALAIESKAFAQLLIERPHLSMGLMRLMTGYIQEMQERYRELATERVEQRIARTLLRLAAQVGRKQEHAVVIDLVFTREDLAEMAGTTLYTVSRVLSTWERQGLLTTGRQRVTLHNPHGLVRIADNLEP